VRQVNVEDLFFFPGYEPVPEPDRKEPLTENELQDVKALFTKDYAPGLDKFLETDWYSQYGLEHLLHDEPLTRTFAHMIGQFRTVPGNDSPGLTRVRSLEVKVVWQLFCLCRVPPPTMNGSGAPPADQYQPIEVVKRLEVFETLITGHFTDSNPVMQIRYDAQLGRDKYFQVEFWRLVGEFISTRPPPLFSSSSAAAATADTDPATAQKLERILYDARAILYMLENRDVLYSVMIARHVGPRVPEFPGEMVDPPRDPDPENVYTKLWIAKKFIENESQGQGTTQVVQRCCDMAVRSWTVWR